MASALRTVALLPMKAHSERVPQKNFRSFAGKPLFAWMLDKLIGMSEIDLVIINTDAVEFLASKGVNSGGKLLVRERRPELCGDFVSMNRIIEDDIAAEAAARYVMTHTTNPLMSQDTVRNALRAFDEAAVAGADSLFSVTKHQTRFYRRDGSAINHDPSSLLRTQDLEPWFEENSNIYVFTRESFTRAGARIGANPVLFETPRAESADIDDAESWRTAEALAIGLRSGT